VLNTLSSGPRGWYVTIKLDSQNVKFKIDTGATVTAIPAGFAKTGKLTKLEKCLMGAGGHRLHTLGCFCAEL